MAVRLARASLIAALSLLPAFAGGQSKAPSLSKEQRQALQAAVTAVKSAPPLADDDAWQMHRLRASDGSHYIAFSIATPDDLTPTDRLVVYVRLAPRPTDPPSTAPPPRSAVEEWLRGERSDPLPMRARRVVTVPSGELPMGGTAATMTRDGSGQNAAVIALMERQLQKQREEEEARKKARREELEGRTKAAQNILPFEDFDLRATVLALPGRRPVLRRAITAGPGDYDVVVGWAVTDDKNRPVRTGAVRHAVSLPPVDATALAVGSVILADAIHARTELYTSDQQTAHPYAIGGTEIEPAADEVFTNDERLSVAFQIFNAMPSATGKPDVGVALRLYRQSPSGEELAATLAPLSYTEATLPADFDLTQGHPLLAAFAAPLGTLPRGDYRLAIGVTDRQARVSTTAETRFRIIATPATLLAGAPAFTAPFTRTWPLDAAAFDAAMQALDSQATSPGVAPLLSLARQHRFVDLMTDPSVAGTDLGTARLLQGIAAYALGDTPRGVAVRLGRAREGGAPEGALQYWLGATLALERRDADAIEAWQAARDARWPNQLVAPLIADAFVRLGRLEDAGRAAREAIQAGIAEPGLVRVAAAADIATRQYARAAERLAAHLGTTPADSEARWMLIHALFGVLTGPTPTAGAADVRARFEEAVRRYVAEGGRHRTLAEEWLAFVTASSTAAVP